MSKPLESALDAVARMSPDSEIDPAVWQLLLERMLRKINHDAELPN